MYTTSANFLNVIKQPSRTLKCKVLVGATTLYEDSVNNFSIESSLSTDDLPAIGGVVSGKLTITFLRDGKTPSNFTTQDIKPYIGVYVDGAYEYVPLGVFKPSIQDVKKTDKTITVECTDILTYTGEMDYVSNLTFPATIASMFTEMTTNYGITFANTGTLPSVSVKVKPTGNVRSVLCDIAELVSANAVCNRTGAIEFKFLTNTSFALDGSNYINFKLTSDSDAKLSKLICEKDDPANNLSYGDTSGATLTFKNDSVTTVGELTTIYNRIYPLTYTPYECKMQGMPHLDTGDKITITDINSVARTLPILNHKLIYNGGLISEVKAGVVKSTSTKSGSSGGNTITQTLRTLTTDVATIDTLLAGNITADNIKGNSITADKMATHTITASSAVLDLACIQDANIDRASINKVQIRDADIDRATVNKIQIRDADIDRATVNKLVVTNADIANATIQDAKIASLDAGKITTGTLNAGRISAGSVTADKFATQPYGVNILKNADGNASANGTYGNTFTNWITTDAVNGFVSKKSAVFIDGGTVPVFSFIDNDAVNTKVINMLSDKIEINPNKTYIIEGWIQRTTNSGVAYIGYELSDANDVDIDGNGNYIAGSVSPTAGVWTYYSGYIYPAKTNAKLTVAYNYATDTTVTVDDTTGFGTSGSAYIGDKYFNYTNKTATQFTGVTNGNFTTNQSVGSIVGLKNADTSSTATTGSDYQFQSKYAKYLRIKMYGAYNATGTAEHYFYGMALREVGGTTIYGDTILTGSVTADKIKAGTIDVNSAVIANGAITNAQIDRATVNKLVVDTADIATSAIKTAQIDNGAITNAKVDRLSANKFQVQTADIVDGNITNAKIDRATVNKLVIDTADIKNGAIGNLQIDRGSANKLVITNADIANASIDGAKINTLDAGKITTGTLDAGNLTVVNLKADSITTGSLTIDGDNLIHESSFNSTATWTVQSPWSVDTTTKYDTSNTMKISRTGLVSDVSVRIMSEKINITSGQSLVGSCYAFTDNISNIDGSVPLVDVVYFNSSDTVVGENYVSIKPTSNNTWQRFVISMKAPTNTAYAKLYIISRRNGNLWVARPMLQKGSVASEWKLHTDEQITDGSINNDKIADNTITRDKIVANTITANEIASRTIKATNIETGTITANEIGVDAITANKIKAGEVTADKLNVYGLKVTSGGIETFTVNSDGQVAMAGDVKSTNYNSVTGAGWKISANGNADFYNANIRGDVLLPNAGMTNIYDNTQVYGRNLLLNSLKNSSGTSYLIGDFIMSKDIVAGNTYTVVLEGTKQATQTFGLWQNAGATGKGNLTQIANTNRYYLTFTATAPTTGNERKISIYNPPSSASAWTLAWIALYEGSDLINDWSPAPEDNVNPVRMWAGTDFITRETAPFRVYQDGSIYATKGTFNGTVSGRVDIGNIHIVDTNSTNASILLNSNSDASTIIKLEETSSFINTEFTIGNDNTKYFYVNGSSKTSFLQDVAFKIGQLASTNNVFFPNTSSGNLIEFVDQAYSISQDASSKAMVFKSHLATTTDDFKFVKNGVSNDVAVTIDGDLTVNNKICMGNVTIQKKSDGIDFIII